MTTKLDLRQTLDLPISENTPATESFQNQTLRPVLKLQNDLYLSYFINYAIRQNADFSSLSLQKKKIMIEQSLQKDNVLKNTFIGMTIGMFTLEEMEIYNSATKVYNKRIVAMLIERLKSEIN